MNEEFTPIDPAPPVDPAPVAPVVPFDPVPEPVPDVPSTDLPPETVDQTAPPAEAPTVDEVLSAPAPVVQQICECKPWEQHPAMSTDFSDYCVTEGLLLLIFVLAFIRTGWSILGRWL